MNLLNKKILLVTAHPDDESLYFLQGLNNLKKQNQVEIFCATYNECSLRGSELMKVASTLNVPVYFGNCKDTGINKLLNQHELKKSLDRIIESENWDLLITHPPHGGEKPHPHHIQIYHEVRELSKHTLFGFFSESYVSQNSIFYFFKQLKVFYYLKDFSESIYLFKKIFHHAKNKKYNLTAFTYGVEIERKNFALNQYKSQIYYLNKYKTKNLPFEYLFIKKQTEMMSNQPPPA